MAVLGIAGARGVGTALARLGLRSGFEVILFDQHARSMSDARESLARELEPGEGRQPIPEAALRLTETLDDLAGAELVIEAVMDTRDSKKALLTRLDAVCQAGTSIATTTGTLSITALAATTGHPERIIGMHFARPVASTELVEIVPGLRTTPEVIEQALAVAKALGKTSILVKNRPGFLANRLANSLRLESVRVLEDSVADPATVDALLGAMGFSPGPLARMDAAGLDACLAISQALFEGNLGEPRYQPPLLQVEMVDAGYTGRKAGKGFHEYPAR